MAQSTEYPDLPFVAPAAFGRGRDGYTVQYLVIHYTAGSERSTSAEDGAAYDQRRTDGTSTHYFVDQNSVVQCVYTWDRANACFFYGNRMGIQYELCGTVQTRAQWLDPASDATLTLAAKQAARDCARYGLPVRKLTPAQMKAGWKGICGHHDVTLAYGLGDHTDPGAEFPWDVFLDRVAAFAAGSAATATSGRTDDMAMIATDGQRYYVVSGFRSTPIATDMLPHVAYVLRQQGALVSKPAGAVAQEWTSLTFGTSVVDVRIGWNPNIFGPVDQAPAAPVVVELDETDRAAIVAGVVDGVLPELPTTVTVTGTGTLTKSA